MIEIQKNIRNYVDTRDCRVMVRVRWNHKSYEVRFSTGVYVQLDKWDEDVQRAKKNTTHIFGKRKYSAYEINACLAEFEEAINTCFDNYSLRNSVPTPNELKAFVNSELGRTNDTVKKEIKTLKQLYDEFIKYEGRVRNWDSKCKEKYYQAYTHYTSANPKITPDKIDLDSMYDLRDWYVDNGYKNRTINKQTTMLKCFFKYIDQQDGYSIPKEVFGYKTNLKVIKKTVVYLTYDELIMFYNHKFANDEFGRLEKARDIFCFMSFTSLRFSDVNRLIPANITNDKIELVTQKTSDRISIPLIDYAKELVKKYIEHTSADSPLFGEISNQKLNDAIKDSAREAGLTRLVVDDYFLGTKRKQETHQLCDILSCHAGRKTFVCNSLALGISSTVVRSCTGHTGAVTLEPYVDVASETQATEMLKWNKQTFKSQYIKLFEKIPIGKEQEVLDMLEDKIKELVAS